MRRRFATALALLALLGPTAALQAAPLSGEALEQRVREISDQLRCPTCQAISVNDSEAAFSRQIKDKVRRMVREGQSEEAIKAFFVSRYGEWILRAPKKEGLGLVLWILPGFSMLAIGGWIFLKVRGSARENTRAAEAAGDAPLTEAQQHRIAQHRRSFEEGA